MITSISLTSGTPEWHVFSVVIPKMNYYHQRQRTTLKGKKWILIMEKTMTYSWMFYDRNTAWLATRMFWCGMWRNTTHGNAATQAALDHILHDESSPSALPPCTTSTPRWCERAWWGGGRQVKERWREVRRKEGEKWAWGTCWLGWERVWRDESREGRKERGRQGEKEEERRARQEERRGEQVAGVNKC